MNDSRPGNAVSGPVDRLVGLYRQGLLKEALEAGETLSQERPEDAFVPYLLGLVHTASGELERAAASFRRSLALNPESAAACYNLGIALDRLGKTREAADSYTRALEIRRDARTCNNLGACLLDLGMTEAAAARFAEAVALDPMLAEAHNNLGFALDRLGKPAEAIASCEQALEIRPVYADARNNLGNALLHLGRIDEARACYEAAIGASPDYAEAHLNLSGVKTYQPDDSQMRRIRRRLRRRLLPDRDRMLLSFALAKACADIGSYDDAFACFAEANRLRKAEVNFDSAAVRKTFARIESLFSGDVPALGSDEKVDGADDKQVVFILGMPRSGTSLVEQILASHSRVHGAGELKLLDQAVNRIEWRSKPLTREGLASVRQFYLSGIAGLMMPSASMITDKMPFNFLWVGFICEALPRAKIVHVKRDARATCWSNFKQNFSDERTGFTNDLEDLADYYMAYQGLMDFWHERYPGRILDLSYESLTGDQATESRRLLEYVGLDWEDRCLDFHRTERVVMTASATQVRKEIYTDSREEWRRYERHLEPMLRRLEKS